MSPVADYEELFPSSQPKNEINFTRAKEFIKVAYVVANILLSIGLCQSSFSRNLVILVVYHHFCSVDAIA